MANNVNVVCPSCRHKYLFPEKQVKKEYIKCDRCSNAYIRSQNVEGLHYENPEFKLK